MKKSNVLICFIVSILFFASIFSIPLKGIQKMVVQLVEDHPFMVHYRYARLGRSRRGGGGSRSSLRRSRQRRRSDNIRRRLSRGGGRRFHPPLRKRLHKSRFRENEAVKLLRKQRRKSSIRKDKRFNLRRQVFGRNRAIDRIRTYRRANRSNSNRRSKRRVRI